jgi:hypothetical protein
MQIRILPDCVVVQYPSGLLSVSDMNTTKEYQVYGNPQSCVDDFRDTVFKKKWANCVDMLRPQKSIQL